MNKLLNQGSIQPQESTYPCSITHNEVIVKINLHCSEILETNMTFRPTSIAIDHSFVSQISLQSTEVYFYSRSDERLFHNTLKCLLFVRCKERHNLNSFFAIVMGLSNIAVSRLSQTWEVGFTFFFSLCTFQSLLNI